MIVVGLIPLVSFSLKEEGSPGLPLSVAHCVLHCVLQPIYACNFHVQDKTASNKLLDDLKYNVEVAENLAKEAQV